MRGRVLIVAGSDSGGGAGIQADIKTVTALGGYAATAISALTAQNTHGVFGVVAVPPAFIAEQMELVLSDIGADAIKTGMLHSAEVIGTVAKVLATRAIGVPLVVDPVMVAKGGAPLLESTARATLMAELVPLATLITPNLPETEELIGERVDSVGAMREAAARLQELGAQAVLVKGGHLEGDTITDVLRLSSGEELLFEGQRIETRSTHGTGCTLASAIATGLAQGLMLRDAVDRGRRYLLEALRTSPGLGGGHGPVNHGHTVMPFR